MPDDEPQERVVQYVLEHGPCNIDDVWLNAGKLNGTLIRRLLAQGAPEGMTAYEKGNLKDDEYIVVIAKSQPEDFRPITIGQRRRRTP